MARITRLTERDMSRLVRKVIKEDESPNMAQGISLAELSNKIKQFGGGTKPTNKITLSSSGNGFVYVHFEEGGFNKMFYIEES